MSFPFEIVGARLIHLRKALGLKSAEICRQTGISPSLWSQFEQGKRRIPLDDALILRNKYGASLDWLYAGDESGLSLRVAQALALVDAPPVLSTVRKPH